MNDTARASNQAERKLIRAILIDPEQRSFTEVKTQARLEDIYKLVGCRRICTPVRPLNGSMSEGFDTIYVSDDDLPDDGFPNGEGPQHWFQVDADRKSPSSYPIGSKGLVVGVDKKGASCDARINIDELEQRVTFARRLPRGHYANRPFLAF
jgi:hypothetical protein